MVIWGVQLLTFLLSGLPIPNRQVARCIEVKDLLFGMTDHDSQVCTTNGEIDKWAIVFSEALESTNV